VEDREDDAAERRGHGRDFASGRGGGEELAKERYVCDPMIMFDRRGMGWGLL
jgi:hypothetical protein